MTGPLYDVMRWFLSVLPVDEAGRRVFDETLADWRREAAKVSGSRSAFVVSLRSMLSAARSVARVSGREVTLIRRSGVLLRMALWTVGYLVFVSATRSLAPYVGTTSPVSPGYAYVAMVAFFLPIALLLATGLGGRRRPSPALGLGLAAAVVGMLLLGWGVPMANRAFLDANPAQVRYVKPVKGSPEGLRRPWRQGEGLQMATNAGWNSLMSPSPLMSFSNDLTVPQLGGLIAAGPDKGGWNAILWLNFFSAYVAMCLLIPSFASALWRKRVFVRLAVIAATAALVFDDGVFYALADRNSLLLLFGVDWIPALLMAAGLVVFMRSDRAGAVGAVSGANA
jgi:hypothetical protein